MAASLAARGAEASTERRPKPDAVLPGQVGGWGEGGLGVGVGGRRVGGRVAGRVGG